jgi:hypothetical protein
LGDKVPDEVVDGKMPVIAEYAQFDWYPLLSGI